MIALWFALPINPTPWVVGDVGIGRKNKGYFARISPDAGLVAFQEAVREELEGVTSSLPPGEYKLTFFLWRKQIEYISNTDRRVRRHQADATNMQKALEDALQGVLFSNDRDVRDVRTVVVAQGHNVTPMIVIKAELFEVFDPHEIPDNVWERIDAMNHSVDTQVDSRYEEGPDLF